MNAKSISNNGNGRKASRPATPGRRTHLYLNSFLDDKARKYMAANNVSITELMRKALAFFLSQEESHWNLVLRGQEYISQVTKIILQEHRRLANFFVHFLHFFFMLWPDTDPDKRQDLVERSFVMSEQFLKTFEKRLNHGGYLKEFGLEDIKAILLESAGELDPAEVHELAKERREQE
jgi:hypothetical protein